MSTFLHVVHLLHLRHWRTGLLLTALLLPLPVVAVAADSLTLTQQWLEARNARLSEQQRHWFAELTRNKLLEADIPAALIWPQQGIPVAEVLAERGWIGAPLQARWQDGAPLQAAARLQVEGRQLLWLHYADEAAQLYHDQLLLEVRQQRTVLMQSEGSPEGIRILSLGKDVPALVKVVDYFGGSGTGCRLYRLSGNRLKPVLDMDVWGVAGWNFADLDGDGVFEVVHGTRITHPSDLQRALSLLPEGDDGSPFIYRDRIYRWNDNRFQVLSERYHLADE